MTKLDILSFALNVCLGVFGLYLGWTIRYLQKWQKDGLIAGLLISGIAAISIMVYVWKM